jgi:hypothetical protein
MPPDRLACVSRAPARAAVLFVLLAGAVAGPVRAQPQEPPADDIAAQVRLQGHPCEGAVSARKDARWSWPDEPLWILNCANASYRVRLVPDMAAHIEKLP